MCITQIKMLTLLMISQILATSKVMQDEDAALIELRKRTHYLSSHMDLKTLRYSELDPSFSIYGDHKYNIVFSFIQAIFADHDFTRFIIMNDFSDDQALCKIMQKIAVMIYTNIEPYMFDDFVNYAKINQISDLVFPSEFSILQYLQRINDLLHLECPQIPDIRFPNRWQSVIRHQYTCWNCLHIGDFEMNSYKFHSGIIDTLQENILKVENTYIPEIAGKKFTCESCSHVIAISLRAFDFDLPAVFVILDDPTGAANNYNDNKSYESASMVCEQVQSKISDTSAKLKEAPETLEIKSFKYEMYAKIHFTRDSIDHIASSYIIFKNGNDWYSYQKKKFIKLLYGGFFDDKEEENPQINNSSVSESNGWLYFYRKVTK